MTARRSHLLLAALLVVSAAVRAVFFLQVRDTHLATVPMLDCHTYHQWAMRLVAGDPGWNETYWMGPLYPHLLALVYALPGPDILLALAVQLGLTLLNLWLVWRLALRVFGAGIGAGGPADDQVRTVALLATALYAGYGAPVFYAGQLLMSSLTTTLLLLVVGQALRTVAAPTNSAWFVTGLLVGAAGLSRGNNLVLLAALPLLLWWPGTVPTPGPRWKRAAALVLGGVVVLTPVTLRNLIVAHDFVILTSNGGINLLIGQQPDAGGIFAPATGELDADFDPSLETHLEHEMGRDLKGSEISRILTGRAWRMFRDNLGAMPGVYLLKAYRFWNGYELPQIVSYDYWRGQFGALRVLVVPYLVLSALGLLGLRFLPAPGRAVLVTVLAGYFLSLLPFFPTARYRQPIAPILALPAAAFVVALVRGTARRRIWLPLAGVLLLALLPRWGALDPVEVLWKVRLNESARAARAGDVRGALARAREAEAVRPGHPDTPFLLGLYLEKQGAFDEAVAALRQAETRAPDERLVPYVLGRNLQEAGRNEEALAALARASVLDSTWANPWHRRALVLAAQGDAGAARRDMERALRLDPGNPRIRANLAAMYAEDGLYERALPLLEGLTRDYPHYVNGWFNLGLANHQAGHEAAARQALARAAAIPGLEPRAREKIAGLRALLDRAGPS